MAEEQPTEKPRRGKLKKWNPKKWKADYDRVVAYHVTGKKNVEIATILGMTPVHVSNILNLERAQQLKAKLEQMLRERMETNIPDTLEYVARKTTERIKQMIDNDDLFEKSPFAVIDRGMDILKGLNHLKGGGNGASPINVERAIIVSGDNAAALASGFDKADEARRINAGKPPGTEVGK